MVASGVGNLQRVRFASDRLMAELSGGHTADMVAESRPRAPIIAVTATREVAQRMALQWGVIPVVHALPEMPNESLTLAARIARETIPMRDGDTIGIVSGHQKDTGNKSFALHTLQAT